MSVSSVNMALQFNASNSWLASYQSPADYPIGLTTDAERNDVRATIRGLYSMSVPSSLHSSYTTVGSALEAAVSRDGYIRVAHSNDPAHPDYSDANAQSHFFIAVNEAEPIWSVGTDGVLRQADPRVVFAHELGHYLLNTTDAIDPTWSNATAEQEENKAGFDYVGNSVTFENAAAKALGLSDYNRASYTGTLAQIGGDNSAYGQLQGQTDFTDGAHVDIVRFGLAATKNNMDLSARTDKLSALMIGFDGADTVVGTKNDDFIYGGTNNDALSGGMGNDHIYGQEGNDNIKGNAGDDYLVGGSGSDTIVGGLGNDFIWAAHGDASSGDKTITNFQNGQSSDVDVLSGGDGNDTFYANSVGTVTLNGEAGNDTFNISEGSVTVFGGADQNSINITPGGASLINIVIGDTSNSSGIHHGNDLIALFQGSDPTIVSGKTYTDAGGTSYVWDSGAQTMTIDFTDHTHLVIQKWYQGDWNVAYSQVIS